MKTSLLVVVMVIVSIFGFGVQDVVAQFGQPGPGAQPGQPGPVAQPGQPGPAVNSNFGSGGPTLQNPLNSNSIEELFRAIIDVVMIFAIPIIVFFIVYAGFLYVTARGNTETIQQAHRALLYALIGALLIIGANVLIDVIGGTVQSINSA